MKAVRMSAGGDKISVSTTKHDSRYPVQMVTGFRWGRFTPNQARRLAQLLLDAAAAAEAEA